jgi:hypothetical protein
MIGFTRFGLRAVRKPDGSFRLTLRAGPLRIDLIKWLNKAKRKEVKIPEAPGKKPEEEPKAPDKDRLKPLLAMIRPILASLRKALRVDRMMLKLIIAGEDDPCAAALSYGRLHIAWGLLRPLLKENLRIKKQRVEIGIDFKRDKTHWEGELAVTISAGRVLGVLLTALKAFLQERRNRSWKTRNPSASS